MRNVSIEEFLHEHPNITTCTIKSACGHFYALNDSVESLTGSIVLFKSIRKCHLKDGHAEIITF